MKSPAVRYTLTMRSTKNIVSGISAAILSLTVLSASAAALSFDSGSKATFSESVNDLRAESRSLRAPSVSTETNNSSELAHFWEELKTDTLDDICRAADIKLKEKGQLDNIGGIEGGFRRRMKRFPNNKLALLDEVSLKLFLGLGQELLHLPEVTGGLSVNLTGHLEGKSQVVRPLESDRYCKELGTLVKLYKVKTVIPAKADRIAKMQVGEIWKLPMGFGVGIGANISEVVNVSLSAGKSKESRPSVTLYRMADDKLRLRLRIDRVEARTVGAAVSTIEIPMADIGLWNAENILADLVNKTWAKEINKYIALKLSFGHSRFSGKKLLLEFILNPNDAAQMEALENFLQGDFGIVKRFLELGLRFSEDDESASGLGEIQGVAQQSGQALQSDPSFAGSNLYHGHANNFNIQVPVAHTHENSWASSYNRYQSLGKEGETIHVQQQTRISTGKTLNIPFVGTVMKYDSQKNVYVVNRESKDGTATRPVFMYQQYEGFVKRGDGTARGMLEKANGVLRYVGMNGEGTDTSNTLPVGAIFPQLPVEGTDMDGYPTSYQPSKTYKAAVMSFKLLINERGVQDIIFAPAQAIMKAYMNMMREVEGEIIGKVMDLFTINKEGKVDYDYKAAQKRLGVSGFDHNDNGTNPLDIVRTLAYTATQVIRDLVSVKETSNWKEQSERLSKVAAGGSKSNLKYEDFLKVIVQLVKPGDVSADVYIHTDKRVKGEADVTQNYQFFNNRDNSFDNTIADVAQMRERFTEPSDLTD